jgi:hypothetical protein
MPEKISSLVELRLRLPEVDVLTPAPPDGRSGPATSGSGTPTAGARPGRRTVASATTRPYLSTMDRAA